MEQRESFRLGALVDRDGVLFRIWAPRAQKVGVILESDGNAVQLDATGNGYYERFISGVSAGDLYRYRLDGQLYPDPASRFQPVDVHGPSMVVDPSAYHWGDDAWNGIHQSDLVFYELHPGTFSPEGTFEGIEKRIPYLKELGITAIELMPLADFPGRWNWGYDPASLYAPSRAYGHPDDLRRLVDRAHQAGLAVFLDVIYNHLGPDGAYVAGIVPMFTRKHVTPWGQGINFDDEGSEGVRHLFIDNALYWLDEFHIDGLRLDATHALQDNSETHFLAELGEAVEHLRPRRYLFAEDPRNINSVILPRTEGGLGMDGIWTDDFHHQVRNITAGDSDGYYSSYAGSTAADLATTLRQGWFYDGRMDRAMGKPRGTDPSRVHMEQLVIAIQNHDQVGNRPQGNRLSDDISPEQYRAASALLLLAPQIPLLFMGQEWAASTPFMFFSDHHDELGRLVTAGRRNEFKHFKGFSDSVPDPQDPATFRRSKLNWDELELPEHARVLKLYRDLLAIRPRLEGPHSAQAHGRSGISVRKGRHTLLVALEGDVVIPSPTGGRVVWNSESSEYVDEPMPPRFDKDQVQFLRAGAVLFEHA